MHTAGQLALRAASRDTQFRLRCPALCFEALLSSQFGQGFSVRVGTSRENRTCEESI